MSDHQPVVEIGNKGFDPGEVDAKAVSVYGLVIIAVIVAVFIGVTLFWDKFLVGRYKAVVEGAPNDQLQKLNARENKELNGYMYVDKAKGQVRIPVDRAVELLLNEVNTGKAPYNTKDSAKPVEAAAPAPAPAAATAAATPAPAAAAAPAH